MQKINLVDMYRGPVCRCGEVHEDEVYSVFSVRGRALCEHVIHKACRGRVFSDTHDLGEIEVFVDWGEVEKWPWWHLAAAIMVFMGGIGWLLVLILNLII